MIEIKQTETFRKWWVKLRDERTRATVAARLNRLAYGLPGDVQPWVMASVSYEFIMDRATEFITSSEVICSLSCFVVETKVHKPKI